MHPSLLVCGSCWGAFPRSVQRIASCESNRVRTTRSAVRISSSPEGALTLRGGTSIKGPDFLLLEAIMSKTSSSYLFTSESVTEGHPDKLCDQISDTILDKILEQDTQGRVACETLLTTGLVFVSGEITTSCYVNIADIVRETIRKVGYDDARDGIDYKTCGVMTAIQEQSPDIAVGVDREGAGDQGMMFGYATDETEELMPMPITYAHQLAQRLSEVRHSGLLPYLLPDGKSQVTVEYVDGKPVRIDTVIIAAQHVADVSEKKVRKDVEEVVVRHVIPPSLIDEKRFKVMINTTGIFTVGGPLADTGLTGRKIIVDTYGGWGRHGGGAFSGKDPTKVDRSGNYMARYVAKNLVAAGVAQRCEIQLSYAIGVAEPISVTVDTFGTGRVPNEWIVKTVRELFDLRPRAIIQKLDLLRPIYARTAVYGHFGRREEGFTWEKTDAVDAIKERMGV